MRIQLLSLRGRDETEFRNALRATGLGIQFQIDCNGTFGIGCHDEHLSEVLEGMARAGYMRVTGEAGSPESVATVYLR